MTLRSAVLALGLALSAGTLLGPADAVAADVFEDGGLVAFLPASPAIAGQSAKLHLLARNADGSPMTDLTMKVTASTGTVSGWEAVGDGVYAFEYTPDAAAEAADVKLTARGKTTVTGTISVLAAPAALTAEVTPKELILGDEELATLVVSGPAEGITAAAAVGEVEGITQLPNGQWSAKYAPPRVNIPQHAIVVVADAEVPDRAKHVVIGLKGKVDYPVTAEPGAAVRLEIAGKVSDPVEADADGKAKVPIEVPPGIQDGTQITDHEGKETRKTIDLRIPEQPRVALFPLPAGVAGGSTITVRAVVLQADGSPQTSEAPKMTASGGTVGDATHLDDGVWAVEWTLPDRTGSVTVTLDGGNDVQQDEASVDLQRGAPEFLALTPDPETIDASTKLVSLTTSGLGGRDLVARLEGGTQQGSPTDAGDGEVTIKVLPRSGQHLHVQAYGKTGVSEAAVQTIALLPERSSAAADGERKIDVLVVPLDAGGLPVAGVDIALSVDGGGSLPKNVSVGATGIAKVTYTAGSDVGLVAMSATSGAASGASAVLLGSEDLEPPVIPASGDAALAALHQRWIDATPHFTVTREGGATVAAAARDDIALVELVAEPEEITPGTTVTITVGTMVDDDGNPVEDYVPVLVPSTGTVGEAVVAEDGAVTFAWELPDDAPETAEIRAMNGDEEVGKLAVDVVGGAVADAGDSPWGPTAIADADPEDEEQAEDAEVAPEPEPLPMMPKEFPWFRARLSGVGSTYRYEQSPSDQPGPLLPSTLAVGGPSGGAAASPLGGEVDIRAWGDGVEFPYVGVHGQFRFTGYAIEAAAFNGTATDTLYNAELDLLARYAFDSGGDRYWVGGKVGYHYNDFLLFTGCLDPGCDVSFDPIGVSGLGLGPELGAEIGDVYLLAGYSLGLAAGSEPYSSTVDVNVGYGFLDNVFADAGFSVMSRAVILEGETSGLPRGEINDSQMMFKLGAGLAF